MPRYQSKQRRKILEAAITGIAIANFKKKLD
jgi:hypothetical protein